MKKILKFNPTVPVKFYEKTSTYVPGQGAVVEWKLIESPTGGTSKASVFYCEWQSAYGERATAALSIGVKDSVRVRTFFNPTLYTKLTTSQVVAVKNADSSAIVGGEPNKNSPNVYELWSGIDNVREENQFLEFHVRRYEGK
jgi:hypothetical protein